MLRAEACGILLSCEVEGGRRKHIRLGPCWGLRGRLRSGGGRSQWSREMLRVKRAVSRLVIASSIHFLHVLRDDVGDTAVLDQVSLLYICGS